MNPTTDRRITTISTVAIIIALIGSCCRFTAAQQHQPTESELTAAGDDGTSTLPEDVELLTGRDGLPTGKLGTPFHHQPTIYSPYGPGIGGGGIILQPQLVRPTFISNTLDRVILVEASRMMRLMGFRGISHFIRGMVRDQDERLEKQRQQLQHQLDHHHHSTISGIISDSPSLSSYRPLSTIKNYTSYAPPPSGLVSLTNRLKRSHYEAINSTNYSITNNNNRDIFNMGFGKTMMQIGFNVGLRKYLRFMMQQAVGPAFRATAILFGDNAEAGPMGHIVFTQFTLSDPVMVTINATGLPAGKHAIHVHAYGDLREGCKSTGPHLRNILVKIKYSYTHIFEYLTIYEKTDWQR